MQILPSVKLLPFIKHYLFFDSGNEGFNKLRMFPDGNSGMAFSFGASLVPGIAGPVESLPSSFIYGQINAFRDLFWIGPGCLVIVVFQPAGIRQLIGIPAGDLRDHIVRAEDIFGNEGHMLSEKLFERDGFEQKWAVLNTFFEDLACKRALLNELLIDAAVNFIAQRKGTCTMGQLTNYTGYTERHIERIFNDCIGLRPKEFGNIVRLHHFIKLAKAHTGNYNLTAISCEAGFADQSHLIKDFKKYTGLTPKEYLNNPNKLAVNFVTI